MKKLLSIIVLIVLLACNHADNHAEHLTGGDTITTDTVTVAAQPVLTSSLYTGILPCADCDGIETDITLNSDSSYSIHTIYQGRKSTGPGSNEFNETGKWMLHGADMIHLKDRNNAPSMFLRTDSSLVQLDMNGNKIAGKLADKYILKKH